MTIANDADRIPPAPAAGGASANGSATLRDRVRSLQLSERGAAGKGASFAAVALPWGLCFILAGVAAAFGYYAYVVAPTHAADAKASDDAAQKTPKDGSPAALTSDVASSGDVALEAKGYIIPVHQIQVSPKVAGMLIDIDPRLEEGPALQGGRHPRQDRGRGLPHDLHALPSAPTPPPSDARNRPWPTSPAAAPPSPARKTPSPAT